MQNLLAKTMQSWMTIKERTRGLILKTAAASLAIFGLLFQSAAAQDKYPTKPIRFVVAFAPGGITDIIARLVGEKLSERLGQTIVIDNKGGAAGAIGAKLVATSDPDGYTFLVTTTAIAVGAAATPNAVDPRTQLVPVAMAASAPTILSAKAPVNSKNLVEFVRDQKLTNITYASSGAGTVEHLTAAYLLKGISGISAVHVPFRSGGEAVNAVIGSHVNLSATPVGSAMSFVQDGQLKILGVAAKKRVAMLPDVPTFSEFGLSDIESASWVAIFGPPGLPDAVAQKINAEVNQVMQQPELRARLTKMGFDLRDSSQKQFADHIKVEIDNWTKVIKDTGITLN